MSNIKNKISILDCTFRDGGYYNSWDYAPDLVQKYLNSLGQAQVDVIEIGFRMPSQSKFLGAFAYSSDAFLETLNLPASVAIGVMINAKDFIANGGANEALIRRNFRQRSESCVSLVRIAAHFGEIEACKGIVARLKGLGYEVGFNIMQASNRSPIELAAAAESIESWNLLDVLYFADSLGNMNGVQVREIVKAFGSGWSGPIGIHAHDNMGNALANTLAAIEAGATWVDATILGMGRGAGNAKTENLLIELKERRLAECHPEAVFSLVMDDFQPLQARYGWGSNLFYYLSAIYSIHPTYIQELLSSNRYNLHQILSCLDALKGNGAEAYSAKQLNRAVLGKDAMFEGSWNPSQWAEGQDVLIIGPGPGSQQHKAAIEFFVDQNKPVVISLNASNILPPEKVTAYAACHSTRIALEVDMYRKLKRPIILPLSMVPPSLTASFEDMEVLDYGIQISADAFEARATSCSIPNSLVAPYVFALATSAGAKRILLAGFDGYGSADPRQEEMEAVIKLYKQSKNALPIVSVTPSSYSVPQSSLYDPSWMGKDI